MEVVSISPLRTGSLLWQASPGAWVLTVVCKATYVLAPAESPLASEQEAPNEDDTYWDDDPARSLHSAADLVPFKLRADVLLVGHAFAPGERSVRSLVARMVIGDVDKALEAVCDRYFSQDGKLHEGAPFKRMSLGYERAFGGPGTSNPVGIRRDTRDAYGKSLVPNLQPPGMIVTSPADLFDPIGFGPVAPIWPSRREKLGRHGANPQLRALLQGPLPEDFDHTFWNAAPYDQQLSALRNNERIVLENLHPDHPRLVTSLPGLGPRAFIDGRAGGSLELPMNADTLFIDTDRALCSVTWRGSFQLEHAHERGRVIVGMEQPGKPLSWADAERLLALQEKGGSPGASAPRQRPDIDIANTKEAARESTSTYIDALKEPTMRSKALPFAAKRETEESGPSAAVGGSAVAPPRPSPQPPAAKPLTSMSDAFNATGDPFSEDEPFTFQTKTYVESDLAEAKNTTSLPFASSKASTQVDAQPPSSHHSSGLPFVTPGQPPRPGGASSTPQSIAQSVSQSSPPSAMPVHPAPPLAAAPQPASALSTPAPPPLYIAESIASWGTAQPPPQLGAIPGGAPLGAGAQLGGEVPHAWTTPSRIVVPPSSASSQAPQQFRVPAPPAVTPPPLPAVESPWASGAPLPLSLPARPSHPSLSSLPPLPIAPGIGPSPQEAAQGLSSSKDASDPAALAASNAAAERSGPWYPTRSKEILEEEAAPESSAQARPEKRAESHDIIELLWFEPENVPRMRRQAPWREILDEIENRPADADLEETTPHRSTAEAENQRDVFEILARGARIEGDRIYEALEKAIREDGKFVPPLALVSGDLAFPFDEAEMLKAYIAAATPLATNDENLRSSITLARDFLSAPGLVGSPGVAEGLIARMKEAFAITKRPVPADYLETQTARALLEKRSYQRRDVFGSTYIRGLYHSTAVTGVSTQSLASAPGAGAPNQSASGARAASTTGAAGAQGTAGQSTGQNPIPVYLPDGLAKKLPLFQRFRIRMIAEVHMALDQAETHPLALKTAALARAMERPRTR